MNEKQVVRELGKIIGELEHFQKAAKDILDKGEQLDIDQVENDLIDILLNLEIRFGMHL